MSIVKPPTLKELIETYGSAKEAVLRLIEAGFSPEQIEWRTGIPYYLIRLYMEGEQPKKDVAFSKIVEVYERLAVLRGKKGKETELTKFFQNPELPLEAKTRFALGTITEESLKVGPGLIERSISLATGVSQDEIKKLLIDYGEHGEVAYLLKKPSEPTLSVNEVYEAIKLMPKLKGIRERELYISSLLKASTPLEAKYIVRLLLGDLKLGYYASTVMRAAAKAHNVPQELIQNACAIMGITEGISMASEGTLKLAEIKMRPGRFIKPQLAHLYEPDKIVYPVRAEYKLDGSRLQIHKWGTQTWIFSRRGVEKSQTLPEVVEITGKFGAQSCIVDGEVLAIDEAGNPLPFQVMLERTVPRELAPEELKERMEKVRVTFKAFDILFLNGQELTRLPLSERRKYLLEIVPPEYIVEGRDCQNEVELMRFYEEALKKKFEGIVVKSLNAPYEIGQRTYTWLKLKPERDTIDCTIVKALYGKGRRAGLYSSFLLAVRDPTEKKLYTIGKVSNLPEQTMDTLRTIIEKTGTGEDEEGVFVKPTVVVEATYQEIQETDEYTSGYALRVPKIVRFRTDKTVEEIDTVGKLKKLYELQYERYPTQSI
ncbi:MAG: ATP-dependent DNA ligase [Candidatus Bathyarchaeota archaeon]|jgi:DNA ligase-1|nr:ATP-dependent DNA ligase [Candidatus Bathyarchaeota archaeon A05DMB-3]MDH7606754.1 ATP-dependent DNA ligase [Candidatus Bathyarchaeota archaeon]